MAARPLVIVALLCVGAVLGCTEQAADDPAPPSGEGAVPAESPPGSCPTPPSDSASVEYDEPLHDELIAMLERDQAGRTGGSDPEGDEARTARLREIFDEHGWPGFDLVGEDGEDAAWTIAQHADLDPEFQRCALGLLRAAVEQGQGSPGNLAYLSDRVAAGAGGPQRYGTQLRCAAGGPKPATPLTDPDRIEELRAELDLPPWSEYLKEFAAICDADR